MHLIDLLQNRGFIESLTNEKGIRSAIDQKKTVYIGFDATAPSLHLGNFVGLVALMWFQKFGVPTVALIGGATTKIGDPSGKSKERPLLSIEEIQSNIATIEEQIKCFVPGIKVFNNDDWFSQMNVLEFLRDVGKSYRMGVMLSKESVKLRIDSEEGMSFTEFSYQILQGYDFHYLAKHNQVKMQMGGSDQWGNIVSGIDYHKKISGEELFGLTFPLLTRSDGKKFGKSEEGAIWLAKDMCSPYRLYQYLMRVPDVDVAKLMKMLTLMETEEIERLEKQRQNEELEPNVMQKKLAEQVTELIHGKHGLEIAEKVTACLLPGSKAELDPDTLEALLHDMPSVRLKKDQVLHKTFAELSAAAGLLSSKGEGNRLIKNGGAYINNMKIEDTSLVVNEEMIIGHRFVLLGSGKKKKLLIQIGAE